MKKIALTLMMTVGMHGYIISQTPEQVFLEQSGWQTVAKASVQLAKDEKTQQQAVQSIKKIMQAVQEFVEFGLKEVADKSDKQGKENIKKVLDQLDGVMNAYMPAIEKGDFYALSEKEQDACNQAVQEMVMFCMPLIAMLNQSDISFSMEDALLKKVWIEFISGLQQSLSHVKKEIK